MGYFGTLCAARRDDPRDDLVSKVLHWQIDGKPIPEADVLSFCLLMFMAGLDTVSIQICWMFWHLTHNDHDRRRSSPSLTSSIRPSRRCCGHMLSFPRRAS